MMIKIASAFAFTAFLAPVAVAAEDSHGEGGFIGGLKYSLNDPVTHVAFLALLVFLAIAWRMGAFKAILGGLDNRAAAIKKELEEAQSLREQAAEALALAERRQQDADQEAEAMISQAKEDAKAIMEAARIDMADKLARREALAEARIARAEAEATQEVRRAAAEAATNAAKHIIRQGDGADHFARAITEIERALD